MKSILFMFVLLLSLEHVSGDLKFAYVYEGEIGDVGWTFSHDQARIKLEKMYNDISTQYFENIGVEDAPALIDRLAKNDFNVVAFTLLEYSDAIKNASSYFPSMLFVVVGDNYEYTDSNVASIDYLQYEADFLAGILAAIRTSSNKIGFIAGFEDYYAYSGANSLAIGAKLVNPNIESYVIYTSSWSDEVKEARGAEILIQDYGVDVVTQNTDSFAPMKYARDHNAWGIGYGSDMFPIVGPNVITSITIDWSVGLAHLIDEYRANSTEWNDPALNRLHYGIKEGMLTLSPLRSLDQSDPKFKIFNDSFAALKGGNDTIFCGDYALQLQNATDLVNGCLTYEQIRGMSAYIKEVDNLGSIDEHTQMPTVATTPSDTIEDEFDSSASIKVAAPFVLALVYLLAI